MMDDRKARKISRKVKRCEEILFKHRNVKVSKDPCNSLFIGNGGLGCGLKRESLIDIFKKFGLVIDVILLPGEPYSFVIFSELESAKKAMNTLNGQNISSGHTFYMSYIQEKDVPSLKVNEASWPQGLFVLEDFLNEEEEQILLEAVSFNTVSDERAVLKHRKVKHFGYEFNYDNNNIDRNKPLDEKIPDACLPHLERLKALGHISRMPDQLTVNLYHPGQGIPPHIDTHSAFEDGIVSISLGSQVVMEFTGPQNEEVPVLLPRRSALVMTGESRYLWKHGITPRKTDVVPCEPHRRCNQLTLSHRETRTSLTFRIIRQGSCDCDYMDQCDSQMDKRVQKSVISDDNAEELEKKYVFEVYDDIADHFSNTRYKPWPKVADFLRSVPAGSLVLDIGCGNGKNLKITSNCFEIGSDASANLAQVCFKRGVQVVVADCLRLPFRDECADVVICIAVIHHMSTQERRLKALKEIIRVLRPKGKALVYVWAFEQESAKGQSKYLKKPGCVPLQDDKQEDLRTDEVRVCESTDLPVHRNKTGFRQQDVLVPWKKVSKDEPDKVRHRFYHVFVKGELQSLVGECGAKVISSYYDEGNWCCVLEK